MSGPHLLLLLLLLPTRFPGDVRKKNSKTRYSGLKIEFRNSRATVTLITAATIQLVLLLLILHKLESNLEEEDRV